MMVVIPYLAGLMLAFAAGALFRFGQIEEHEVRIARGIEILNHNIQRKVSQDAEIHRLHDLRRLEERARAEIHHRHGGARGKVATDRKKVKQKAKKVAGGKAKKGGA